MTPSSLSIILHIKFLFIFLKYSFDDININIIFAS